MELVLTLAREPWTGYVAGIVLLALCAAGAAKWFARRAAAQIQARICEVGRSGVVRIDAGHTRGVQPGLVLTVYRSVANRQFSGGRLETIDMRWLPIGRVRVVTVGLGDALCKFLSCDGATVRVGDRVLWTVGTLPAGARHGEAMQTQPRFQTLR